MILNREPALILSLVSSAVAVAVGFGLNVTPEQTGLIMACVSAVIGVAIRSQVSPVADSTPPE